MADNLACLIKGHTPGRMVTYTRFGVQGYCLLCDRKLICVQMFDRDAEEWVGENDNG